MTDDATQEFPKQPQTGHQSWCQGWQRCPDCRAVAGYYYPDALTRDTIGARVARASGSQPVMTVTEQGNILFVGLVALSPVLFLAAIVLMVPTAVAYEFVGRAAGGGALGENLGLLAGSVVLGLTVWGVAWVVGKVRRS